MNRLLLLALAVTAVAASSGEAHHQHEKQQVESEFRMWMQRYNKDYSDEAEYTMRLQNYAANKHIVAQMNEKMSKEFSHGQRAYYGPTKFADMSVKEFKAKMLTYKKTSFPARNKINIHEKKYNGDWSALPVGFDWNSKNAVTPVKNQGQCGSCWAFSTSETIESQWFLANHSLPGLSEQQIVDCDTADGNQGCGGGDTTTAYQYVIKVGGLESENSYPYAGFNQNCQFKSTKIAASIKSWGYVTTTKNETEMLVGLYNRGPLSICVDAESWQFYMGGIIQAFCGNSLDHCVQITGFNTYNEVLFDVPYWHIRNSWGGDWGESGYLRVQRGSDLCGVADEVTLPVV